MFWNIVAFVFSIPLYIAVHKWLKKRDFLKSSKTKDFSRIVLLIAGVVLATSALLNLFITSAIVESVLFVLIIAVAPTFSVTLIYQLKKYYARLAYDNEIKAIICNLEKYRKLFLSDWAQKGIAQTAKIYNNYAM